MRLEELQDLVNAGRSLRRTRESLRELDDGELMVSLFCGDGTCVTEIDIEDGLMVAAIKDYLRVKLTADLEEATKLLTAAGVDLPEEEPEEDDAEDEQEAA
jgi:hypothetical protein